MYTITPAAPADVPEAAAVLGQAFEGDAVLAAVTGRPHPSAERLTSLFAPLLRSGALAHGAIDLARTADGSLVGVAVWEPPDTSTHLLRQALEVPALLRALGLRGAAQGLTILRRFAQHRPAEKHWYLGQIGAVPSARGTGVGSTLLRDRLRRIDAEGSPAYLESSNENNRRLYARAGFQAITSITGIGDALPMAMWRPAATGRGGGA